MPKLPFINRTPKMEYHNIRASSFLYAIGPAGIAEIRSTGNPLLDAFHGITGDDGEYTPNDDGFAKAYRTSAWVYRCVKVRAQTLASIPLQVQTPEEHPLNKHAVAKALSNGDMLMYRTECDMAIFGRAFWEPTEQGLRRINPHTIEVVAGKDGIEKFKYTLDGQLVKEYEPNELVYFFDYNPDSDLDGLSPLALALGGVKVTENIGLFAEYYFENNAMPTGILVSELPLTDTDRKRVEAEWRRKFQGVEKSHGTALLEGGRITYQPLTPPLTDLAMPELREEERREIAAALGVPLTVALMTDAANYATMKEQHVMFYTSTVLPELEMLVSVMNRQLMPRYPGAQVARVVVNTDDIEVLQEDRTEITQRNQMAVGAGYMSVNEARERDGLDPLATDLFFISGKPITREALEAGDLSTFEPAAAPAFPFGMALTPREEPRQLTAGDSIPQKAVIDIVVHADHEAHAAAAKATILNDTVFKDLDRWQRKVEKKGTQTPFSPDYLHSAVTDFLRYDLLCAGDDEDAVKAAFERAAAIYKADDDLATPEEFEAYWRGIGELFAQVETAFDGLWADMPTRMATALRESGQAGAEFDMQSWLDAEMPRMVDMLTGTEDNPGALVSVFLAGAARGDELLRVPSKATTLTIDWTIIDTLAREWARTFAADLVRGVNDTTLSVFRDKIAEWVNNGGSLEDLAKYVEGDLVGLEIPANWSPGKVQWATSRERARLIAQTETTRAFYEGAVQRWEQAGVTTGKWRTQNDPDVCKNICRPLNNTLGAFTSGWKNTKDGKLYKPPAHPGCRCFVAPQVEL